MLRSSLLYLWSLLFVASCSCSFPFLSANEPQKLSHYVIVSIAPYKFFVEAIAGDTLKVGTIVPPNVSFHSFEPNPKEILKSAEADIWFRVGESFESRILQALRAYRPNMRIVDLREGVNLITVSCEGAHCPCCNGGEDLHMWLSPRIAKIQAKTIADSLVKVYPENTQLYQDRLADILLSLDKLDQEIIQILQPLKHRTIMVAHPAYAYFARDYGIVQMPIEFEGKDPSPRQLTELLQRARKEEINTVFIQNQYSTKGANLIAKELHAKLVTLDPYSSDYFAMMREIAQRIAAQDDTPRQ